MKSIYNPDFKRLFSDKKMAIIRKILNFFGKAIIVVALAFAFFYLEGNRIISFDPRTFMQIGNRTGSGQEARLPARENPEETDFKWTFDGKSYRITETLYRSFYDFYAAQPKDFSYVGELPVDWQEQYFKTFITVADGDDTFQRIAADIKAVGLKNGLSDNQIVELTMSFVQSIPYDDARAKDILGEQEKGLTRYPYETLYGGRGVCSDKSFLAYILLRELGYGAALFVYTAENHMAVAVQCPDKYSSYGSGYCYAETTAAGEKIGMIPALNSADNRVQSAKKVGYFSENQASMFDTKRLGPVAIYEKQAGGSYSGIIDTLELSQEIGNLSAWLNDAQRQLKSAQADINNSETVLRNMKDNLDKLRRANDRDDYNQLVVKYNALIMTLKSKIASYNKQIKQYNQKVSQYNSLI